MDWQWELRHYETLNPGLRLTALGVALFLSAALPCPTDPLPQGVVKRPLEISARERQAIQQDPAGVVQLSPVPSEESEERWHDILGTPYSDGFCGTFRYDKAKVEIRYSRLGRTFQGCLTATGLKPNFAYQIKLRGDYAVDPVIHRYIGYLGRWRLSRTGTNFSDESYENEYYCPKSAAESYILFDYFVTDSQGKASHTFSLNSSLHVYWNDVLNSWTSYDRELQLRTFRRSGEGDAYESPPEPGEARIWAETERGRAPPGALFLPEGRYACEVVLTEESFHKSYLDGGGYWATVMAGPVRFIIER